MGTTTSQTALSQQEIFNDINQTANTMCIVDPSQSIDNTTIIAVGQNGNITLKNSLDIEKAQCNLAASLDSTIDNLLKSALEQKDLVIPDIFTAISGTDMNQYLLLLLIILEIEVDPYI